MTIAPEALSEDGLLRLAKRVFAPEEMDKGWLLEWLRGPCGRQWCRAVGLEARKIYSIHAIEYRAETGLVPPPFEESERCPGEPGVPDKMPRLAPHEAA